MVIMLAHLRQVVSDIPPLIISTPTISMLLLRRQSKNGRP